MPITERRCLRRRLYELVSHTDTTPTRFTLALAATLLAVSSWSADDDCTYIGCVYLAQIAPWQVWTIGWSIYAVLKWWRLFDGTSRPRIALFVNTLGSFMFVAAAIALTLARWPFVLLSSASIALACASLWVLMRTGINAGYGFQGD